MATFCDRSMPVNPLPDLNLFSFQGNKNSTHIHVALLLFSAFNEYGDIKIVPAFDIQLLFKRRVLTIKLTDENLATEQSQQTATIATEQSQQCGLRMVLYQRSKIKMIIEVKTSTFTKLIHRDAYVLLVHNEAVEFRCCLRVLDRWENMAQNKAFKNEQRIIH